MYDVTDSPKLIERLAHFLANAAPVGASDRPALVERASAILAVRKDPDADMTAAGNGNIWRTMVDAALIAKWQIAGMLESNDHTPKGTDEEGDIALGRDAVAKSDGASWVSAKKADDRAAHNRES
jgi:hypothetical protein